MDQANKSRLKFARLLHLEGHRCTFRQVVEPDVAYIAASKRIRLSVLSKERSGAPVSPELRNGASHTLWPTCFRDSRKVGTLAVMSSAATLSPLIALALVNKLSSARVI